MASRRIVVLITGANQGIGFHTARLIAAASPDYHVILSARSLAKAQAAIAALTSTPYHLPGTSFTPLELDVSSEASILAALESLSSSSSTSSPTHLDVLVNNAGISPETVALYNTRPHEPTPSTFAMYSSVFQTNVVGPATVTQTFLPLLLRDTAASATPHPHPHPEPGPRVIYLSSSLGSLTLAADPAWVTYTRGFPAYRASKAALNMVMLQDAKDLARRGGKVWAVDPGVRATNLAGNVAAAVKMGAPHPEGGARLVLECLEGKWDEAVGMVVSEQGVRPW